MAVNGITTIISRSAIPEKMAEVADRSAENKQIVTTAVAQEKAEQRVKTVQRVDKMDAISPVRKRDEEDGRKRREREQEEQERRKKDGKPGGHLDLKA